MSSKVTVVAFALAVHMMYPQDPLFSIRQNDCYLGVLDESSQYFSLNQASGEQTHISSHITKYSSIASSLYRTLAALLKSLNWWPFVPICALLICLRMVSTLSVTRATFKDSSSLLRKQAKAAIPTLALSCLLIPNLFHYNLGCESNRCSYSSSFASGTALEGTLGAASGAAFHLPLWIFIEEQLRLSLCSLQPVMAMTLWIYLWSWMEGMGSTISSWYRSKLSGDHRGQAYPVFESNLAKLLYGVSEERGAFVNRMRGYLAVLAEIAFTSPSQLILPSIPLCTAFLLSVSFHTFLEGFIHVLFDTNQISFGKHFGADRFMNNFESLFHAMLSLSQNSALLLFASWIHWNMVGRLIDLTVFSSGVGVGGGESRKGATKLGSEHSSSGTSRAGSQLQASSSFRKLMKIFFALSRAPIVTTIRFTKKDEDAVGVPSIADDEQGQSKSYVSSAFSYVLSFFKRDKNPSLYTEPHEVSSEENSTIEISHVRRLSRRNSPQRIRSISPNTITTPETKHASMKTPQSSQSSNRGTPISIQSAHGTSKSLFGYSPSIDYMQKSIGGDSNYSYRSSEARDEVCDLPFGEGAAAEFSLEMFEKYLERQREREFRSKVRNEPLSEEESNELDRLDSDEEENETLRRWSLNDKDINKSDSISTNRRKSLPTARDNSHFYNVDSDYEIQQSDAESVTLRDEVLLPVIAFNREVLPRLPAMDPERVSGGAAERGSLLRRSLLNRGRKDAEVPIYNMTPANAALLVARTTQTENYESYVNSTSEDYFETNVSETWNGEIAEEEMISEEDSTAFEAAVKRRRSARLQAKKEESESEIDSDNEDEESLYLQMPEIDIEKVKRKADRSRSRSRTNRARSLTRSRSILKESYENPSYQLVIDHLGHEDTINQKDIKIKEEKTASKPSQVKKKASTMVAPSRLTAPTASSLLKTRATAATQSIIPQESKSLKYSKSTVSNTVIEKTTNNQSRIRIRTRIEVDSNPKPTSTLKELTARDRASSRTRKAGNSITTRTKIFVSST